MPRFCFGFIPPSPFWLLLQRHANVFNCTDIQVFVRKERTKLDLNINAIFRYCQNQQSEMQILLRFVIRAKVKKR